MLFSREELDQLRDETIENQGAGLWMELFEWTVKLAKDYCPEDDLNTND
jgi:hypothetical protein